MLIPVDVKAIINKREIKKDIDKLIKRAIDKIIKQIVVEVFSMGGLITKAVTSHPDFRYLRTDEFRSEFGIKPADIDDLEKNLLSVISIMPGKLTNGWITVAPLKDSIKIFIGDDTTIAKLDLLRYESTNYFTNKQVDLPWFEWYTQGVVSGEVQASYVQEVLRNDGTVKKLGINMGRSRSGLPGLMVHLEGRDGRSRNLKALTNGREVKVGELWTFRPRPFVFEAIKRVEGQIKSRIVKITESVLKEL